MRVGEQLGAGVHGTVFLTESQRKPSDSAARSATKAHRQKADYCRERDVYLRLQGLGLNFIQGCSVPELIRYDDDLLIIEMTVVAQPFILDFAGAFLDKAPEFSEEVFAEWRAEKQEQFVRRWHEVVVAILGFLERYGIYFVDVSPNNIALPEKIGDYSALGERVGEG